MPKHIPDGFHTATPHLIVKDSDKAIAFYRDAFGARELARLTGPGGMIAHAEIQIGDSIIMLADESPEWDAHSPESVGGTPVRLHLYVENADATVSQAVAAGAKLKIPVGDQFYGDRAGRVVDPFGHLWIIATHQQDMTLEEMQRRFDDLMKQ